MTEDEAPEVQTPPQPPFMTVEIMEPALTETSAQYDELMTQLAKAQAEFPDIEKSKTGKVRGTNAQGNVYEYEYKYADLADVLSAVRPVLAKHKIALTQHPVVQNRILSVSTTLFCGAQWMKTTLSMPMVDPGRQSPYQVLGGQITYLRRYSLAAIVGVMAEEDMDQQQPERKQAPTRVESRKHDSDTNGQLDGCISPKQQAELKDGLAITNMSVQDLSKFSESEFDVSFRMLKQVPADLYEDLKTYINRQLDKQASS